MPFTFTHSYTHSHYHGGVSHASQEEPGVRTSDLQVTSQPALPPEATCGSIALPADGCDRAECLAVRPDSLSQLEHLQQQLFVGPVLLGLASVQLEGRLLEEGQGLGQGPQLYQVQEVEVTEPLGALARGQVRVEALLEL